MNKRGLPPAAVADADGRGERAYKSGGFLFRRCRDPCSRAQAKNMTTFLVLKGILSHHKTTYTTKRRGGLVYDLFASFFIAETGEIIYNITRNNILKEDKPQ